MMIARVVLSSLWFFLDLSSSLPR